MKISFVLHGAAFCAWARLKSARDIAFRVIGSILELVLPKKSVRAAAQAYRPGRSFLSTLSVLEPSASSQSFETGTATALFAYRNPAIKRTIWDFKYHMRHGAFSFCRDAMHDELIASMSDRVLNIPFCSPYLVIHCPSSTFFRGEKPFDHMKELILSLEAAQNCVMPFFIACTHAILPHVGNKAALAKAQHFGNRSERFAWAKDRFRLSEEFIKFARSRQGAPQYRKSASAGPLNHIYCIDDVTTTGASFSAIADLIRSELGLGIRCVALAH